MPTVQQARHEGFADHSCTQYRDHHGAEPSGLPMVSWMGLWRLCATVLNIVNSEQNKLFDWCGIDFMACGEKCAFQILHIRQSRCHSSIQMQHRSYHVAAVGAEILS